LSQEREGDAHGEYFLVSTKLDTFCYLKVQTAPCYVQSFDTIPACDRQTDRRKDGIAVAIALALAMRALRRAVINVRFTLVVSA